MMILVTLVHIIFCFLLIAIVLLQDPKNAGAGGMFGGGGANSVLGSTGAVTFLTKLTQWSAVMFGVTCILLTLMSRPESGSVLDTAAPANATTPTTPVNGTAPAVPAAPAGSGPLDSNPAAQKDPKQAGTEAAPAQGDHVVPAEAIRQTAPETPKKPNQ
jgi:preprotein translocase subunit SecG